MIFGLCANYVRKKSLSLHRLSFQSLCNFSRRKYIFFFQHSKRLTRFFSHLCTYRYVFYKNIS